MNPSGATAMRRATRGRSAPWLVAALALCVAALVGLGSCFYAPPAWYRSVEQTRLKPDERRLAIVVRSWLRMLPRGIARFPDGGSAITLRQVADVWVCDPQRCIVRRVATISRPSWVGGAFEVWMLDWQSHGERSSLYLRLTGTKGRTSDTPRLRQTVRVDFDRDTAENPDVVYLGAPQTAVQPTRDFVNPPNEYGIINVRRQGDTLAVWTDRAPDWRARFWIDEASGNVLPLEPIPRRTRAKSDSTLLGHSARDRGCPDNIRGMPSPAGSRISLGGPPPVVTASIARVDVACTERRHPVIGSENDGELEFVISATAWVDYEIVDSKRFSRSGGSYGAEVIFEAVSASSLVLGSTSMGFTPYLGAKSQTLSLEMKGLEPHEVSTVARVVARWGPARSVE